MDLGKILKIFYDTFITGKAYTVALQGLLHTVIIAVCGLVIGIFIGIIIAIAKIYPGKSLFVKVLRKILDFYVAVFRGTPIVVQLLLSYFAIFPLIGLGRLPALIVAIIMFGLNSGAYVSEIIRGGILSVDQGQMEAGRTLGLNYSQTMRLIVLPQAIKNILPTLGNEFITLIKETSVAGYITVLDLTQAFTLVGSKNYEFIIPYLALAAIYFVLVYIISFFVKILERRLRQSDRGY